MKEFIKEITKTVQETVTNDKTAVSVGSGSLPVFSTPMLLALMENATCKAAEPLLEEGETTVGTKVEISHDKASGVNEVITATAVLEEVDSRRLVFSVIAKDSKDDVIGQGKIERFVVLEEKFMRRISL